jgi:mycothiol synthase
VPPTFRLLTTADTDLLAPQIDRAVAAGDLLASSDPAGAFVLKIFAVAPSQFAGAFDDDGALVGFTSPDFKITVVTPARRRRGIGRALLDVAEGMARGNGHPELLMGVLPGDPIAPAFLGPAGFGYHSTVWDLDLPAAAAVREPVWPEGFLGRPFDRNRDVEPWTRVFNAAFADHPTPLQLDPNVVAGGLDDPDAEDADLTILEEVATGEIAGFCAADVDRRDGVLGEHAELWAIGVRPDLQGRGLGRQLVRAGVVRARSLGIRVVSLAVNARNEGALGLYESEGFERVRTRDRWSRPVRPAGSSPA